MHSLSASWWQVLWKLRWPASLPYLFAGLKISAGTAFIGAIVAEWVGSLQGLGYLIILSGNQYRIPMLWATILTASALALSAFFAVSIVEARVLRWAKGGALPD
jgi:NitT/TauT family transport system permease protein